MRMGMNKRLYNLGEDFFISIAFCSFVISGILKLLDITYLFWGITTRNMVVFSFFCLLFSIALSLYDLAHDSKK